MKISEHITQALTNKILDSRKYRHSGLNPETVRDLIHQEAEKCSSEKQLLKAVRRKLHNIVAPYLGEPDYEELLPRLHALDNTSLESPTLRDLCLEVLSRHASTDERITLLSEFYDRLFAVTGKPHVLLDLACGLHPLGFPWMGLPVTTQYYAYDIIQPRVDFLNGFFQTIGLQPLAENRDILTDPPTITADLAIFFKEAHRVEKRSPGRNKRFWSELRVKKLAVSLPVENLSGTHSLIDQHRKLVYDNLPHAGPVTEILFENEIVFVIDSPGGTPT